MKVLMTGVDKGRLGGMWTVANNYITSEKYNNQVDLKYIATSTNGSRIKRIILMLKAFKKIRKNLSDSNYDLVHIHMAERGSTFRARKIVKMAKQNNTKVIIHLHAGPFLDWYSSLKEKQQRNIKEMFDHVDCVLVLGNYWKEKLLPLVSKEKIRVLYNGVCIPNENNYNINGKYITFMGVLKKEKGIFDLIDAIEKIDNELDKEIKVKVCGIDLVGNVQEYINNKNLKNRIELVGWVNEEERKKIYNNTLICVLPSYFEALSMTVIESMANGIPIITTNISTMFEVLDDSNLLIEPGNIDLLSKKIIDMTKNKNNLSKISDFEYKRCKENFDINTNINNTLKIYNEIIN